MVFTFPRYYNNSIVWDYNLANWELGYPEDPPNISRHVSPSVNIDWQMIATAEYNSLSPVDLTSPVFSKQ
jgi:hypothetical protein